jgi:hypothetical protein
MKRNIDIPKSKSGNHHLISKYFFMSSVIFKLLATSRIWKVALKISDNFSGYTQAEFLNFTIYLFTWKSSNLKIWRLPKNAQAFVLATTCAIFYIHC